MDSIRNSCDFVILFDFLGGGAGGGNVLPKAICIPLVMLEPPNMTQTSWHDTSTILDQSKCSVPGSFENETLLICIIYTQEKVHQSIPKADTGLP